MRTGCTSRGSTHLIVLRGNSGSGKTSTARALQATRDRDLAVVSQDAIRRDLLRERDVPGGANIELIDTIARHCLDRGYHVLIEGILYATRYTPMLAALRRDHTGPSSFFYLDISLAETLRRHTTRPQRSQFSGEQMREWYVERDLLPEGGETVIEEDSPLETTVQQILRESGLTASAQQVVSSDPR
ncbi:AAA family ATPase [Streptosporangium sp. NBC_01756]|uniref:AAA family ATPase n=1 Tax=Streptosporangium sp. NBC_01756 TaxID=2975950 RepID=UPI002DDBE646|nr:AAA family ATPase [Streptosporangium sp. NBC_01756]WSC86216.1 AAA family ATPase [Streptosporangium sp. NBC_01756]